MDPLGVEIADLIKTGKVQGVQTDKDDLILDPAKLFPPPHIAGQITAVRLDGGELIQVFGRPAASAGMHVRFANYMAYRGNQLRFGKLPILPPSMRTSNTAGDELCAGRCSGCEGLSRQDHHRCRAELALTFRWD
jgi:hypothetical protein